MNYDTGLSPDARKNLPRTAALMDRTFQFDPGDTEDLNQIMETISAMMEGKPSSRVFADGTPPLVVFLCPDKGAALVMSVDELQHPAMQQAATQFGFHPVTLQPITQ